jgi:hypothetical protein
LCSPSSVGQRNGRTQGSPLKLGEHEVRPYDMTIGVLQLELNVTDAMSLKDKRRVIKSIKDRIAHAHNVSIAEVGALDEHRRSILGMAMVSNDSRHVEGALSKLVDFVRRVPQVSLIDYRIELL